MILVVILLLSGMQLFAVVSDPIQVVCKNKKLYVFDDESKEIQLSDGKELLEIRLPDSQVEYYVVSAEDAKIKRDDSILVTSYFNAGTFMPRTTVKEPRDFDKNPVLNKDSFVKKMNGLIKTHNKKVMGGIAGVGLLSLTALTYSDFVKTLPGDQELGFVEFAKQYLTFIGKKIKTDKKCMTIATLIVAAESYALYIGLRN